MEEEVKLKARKILASNFGQQFLNGNRDAIVAATKILIDIDRGISFELRQQFAYTLNNKFPIPEKDFIRDLLEANEPKTMGDLLKQLVISAPYNGIYKNNEYIDLSEEKIRRMVSAFNTQKNTEWYSHLEELQKGEQRQTFNFGNEVGKVWFDKEEVFNNAIKYLSKISLDEQNGSFINGFVLGLTNENEKRKFIDLILAIDNISFHAIQLYRFINITNTDIEKLYPIFNKSPNYIAGLQYLKFNSLSNDNLQEIIPVLISFGDFGRWISVEILFEVTNSDTKRFQDLRNLIVFTLTQDGILKTPSYNQLSFHFYEELIKKVLVDNSQNDIAQFLTKEIISACDDFSMQNEFHLRDMIFILLNSYWNITWPVIGSIILNRIGYSWFNLRKILSQYRNFDLDKLINWTNENIPNAPVYVMIIVDFEYINPEGVRALSPIVTRLLDLYGKDKRVLDELSAKLHSFSTTGSALPIFEGRIELLTTLLSHQIPEVRAFASAEIEHFKLDIEKEKKWTQNYNLGEI